MKWALACRALKLNFGGIFICLLNLSFHSFMLYLFLNSYYILNDSELFHESNFRF